MKSLHFARFLQNYTDIIGDLFYCVKLKLSHFAKILQNGSNLLYAESNKLFIFAAIPLLALYNGKKGWSKMPSTLFYRFYPGHLLLIYLLQLIFPK